MGGEIVPRGESVSKSACSVVTLILHLAAEAPQQGHDSVHVAYLTYRTGVQHNVARPMPTHRAALGQASCFERRARLPRVGLSYVPQGASLSLR